MALASGVPVPAVYLLNGRAGNQRVRRRLFAERCGDRRHARLCRATHPRPAQGVIAHEFSHILNGDMRLNMRLIGVLHGILLMGLVGRKLLRIAAHGGGGRRTQQGWRLLYLLLIGLAFMILGFLGSFFGNLIKAAVSRQREYLADASAVQFTRNPDGIAGRSSESVRPCLARSSSARARPRRATCTSPKASPACLRPTRRSTIGFGGWTLSGTANSRRRYLRTRS